MTNFVRNYTLLYEDKAANIDSSLHDTKSNVIKRNRSSPHKFAFRGNTPTYPTVSVCTRKQSDCGLVFLYSATIHRYGWLPEGERLGLEFIVSARAARGMSLPPTDSMFSAEKVGSRVEPWPGLAVCHTSC